MTVDRYSGTQIHRYTATTQRANNNNDNNNNNNDNDAKDEIECIMANLIYRGYLKGYIAHAKGYLVVSKKLAFPKIGAVQR